MVSLKESCFEGNHIETFVYKQGVHVVQPNLRGFPASTLHSSRQYSYPDQPLGLTLRSFEVLYTVNYCIALDSHLLRYPLRVLFTKAFSASHRQSYLFLRT